MNDDYIQELPPTASDERMHDLDPACWCFPVIDGPYLRHNATSPL